MVWIATYLADLDDRRFAQEDFLACLSREERRHGDAFHSPSDGRRSLARRAVLRHLLASSASCDPRSIEFSYNEFGKPALAESPLRFNLSHAGNVAFYVVSERDVGCDIEWHRPDLAQAAIAAHFFSPAEQASLRRAAPDEWPARFFDCWTRKEALLKAIGCGLSYPSTAFSVSTEPGAPPRVLHGIGGWRLEALDLVPDLHVAVAVKAEPSETLDYRPLRLPADQMPSLR